MNKLRFWALASLFCVLGASAEAQVQLIGSQLQITSSPGLPLTQQGFYAGWNHASLGETDFFNDPGTGVGGFYWYNTTTATQLLGLDYLGNLTALKSVAAPNMLINGNNTLAAQQGFNLAWNLSGGNGESDFVTLYQSGGVGGFNWYNTGTSSNKGPVLMNLSAAGVLTVATVDANLNGNGAGTWTGPVSGEATTAGALNATPSNCGSVGSWPSGINASGAAQNCSPVTLFVTAAGCTTGSGAGSTCTVTLNWPTPGFSGGSYIALCYGLNPTPSSPGGAVIVQITTISQTGSQIEVQLTSGTASQAGAAGFNNISCVGQQ